MKNLRLFIRGTYYHIEISGVGSPAVLLHGFAGSTVDWLSIQNRLKASHQVIAVDLLGHGKTDAPIETNRYQMAEAVDDLKEIFLQMALPPVILVGYSMGGRLALAFAATYPIYVRHLLLESSSPGLKTEKERIERCNQDTVLAEQILQNGTEWFASYWRERPIFQMKDVLDPLLNSHLQALYQRQKKSNACGLANSLRGMGTGMQNSYWSYLEKISVPTTLICGANDKKFCTINKEMQHLMPDAKLFCIPNAGHRVHLERLDAFWQIMQQHITVIDKEGKVR